MERKESQREETKNGEISSPKVSGLGELLKTEREKRGLSHERVAQITKLRKNLLEAMENEDWENLPPSVFVKGFIRSYARALGLDEKRALELYESVAPVESAPPRPLVEPIKKKRGRLTVLILLLGVIAVLLYLWKGSHFSPFKVKKESPTESRKEPSKMVKPTVLESQEQESVEDQEVNSTPPKANTGLEEMGKPEELIEEREFVESFAEESLSADSAQESATVIDGLVLTGTVRLRTWIKIYIDDQEPKEYIFQPGSRPQWKASEGFDILIGNAAGIEFDLNGKKIENLGIPGQVVRVKLPEDYERPELEE